MKLEKLLLITATTFSTLSFAEEAKIGFTAGVDYSSGKYGLTESTNIIYMPFTGKYEHDRWLAKVTVPWIQIDGPGGATGGESKILIINNVNKHSRESGLGDIVTSLTYTALQLDEQKIFVDVGAKVKFGTASANKGLGTGSNDYSVQTDVYKTLDKLTVLGTVGYKNIGNAGDSNYKLDNIWFGTLGAAYRINATNSAGLLIDLRQAAWRYNTNIREYTMYYTHRFNPSYNLQTYVTTGDTKSSVDFSLGLMLGLSW